MMAMSRPALVIACAIYVAGVMGDSASVVLVPEATKVADVTIVAAGGAALSQGDVEVAGNITSVPAITAVGYPLAVWVPAAATNYTVADRPTDYPVDMIIIHDIEGSTASAITAFQNPTRHGSAHYVISYRGRVTQMVDESDIAWHAGNWDYNTRSIGIEHEGYAYTPGLYTLAEYRASAHVAASICSRWGVQLNRTHVIGHSQVPDPNHPGLYGGLEHHTDPGPYWNWSYYMSYARGYANSLPSPPHMQVDPVAVPWDQRATVSWQPTPTCRKPITSYKVTLQPGNILQTLAGTATSASFSGLTNGTSYSFTVTAINADGQSTLQSNSVIAGSHCATSSLDVTPTSPQLLGTQLRLAAGSTICPNPRYELSLRYPNGTWTVLKSLGSASTLTWDTALYPLGIYTVRAAANQAGDGGAPEAYTDVTYSLTEPPPCTSPGLSPAGPTQPAGSAVNFTASATGCPVPLYEYWVQYPDGTWKMQRTFSTDPTWSWNTSGLPIGTYTVHVWINHPGRSTKTLEIFGSSTVTLTGCTSATLSPDTTTQAVGSSIDFTATSAGCLNPQYEYWVQYPNGTWYLKRGFSSTATWTWNTAGLSAGVYTVHVWANHLGGYMKRLEAFGSSTVTLTG
jgi:hypothetical protein